MNNLKNTAGLSELTVRQLFEGLSADAMRDLETIKVQEKYPSGSLLFKAGEDPTGIFVMISGQACLSVTGAKGRRMVVRSVGAGGVLGLSAAVSGEPYGVTAEIVTPSEVAFIHRGEFLRFLQDHIDACYRAVQWLSNDLDLAYAKVRSLHEGRLRPTNHSDPTGCR